MVGAAVTSDVQTVTGRRVGMPIHERSLTAAFSSEARSLAPPGPGRSLYLVEEPAIGGSGRPDILLLTMAPSAMALHQKLGMRLPALNAARLLDRTVDPDRLGLSTSYVKAIRRDLERQGWTLDYADHLAELVADTLAVEAKMSDWRRAVRQVARFRHLFHRSAVLMPERDFPEEASRSMAFYGCGLLVNGDSAIRWQRSPELQRPTVASRLWSIELALRGFEGGSTHRLSARRNNSIASL